MPVKSVHKDPENLTMVLTADFDAPIERVWQVWADPRRLERWWGPPTYPATFVDHAYYMTGPEGDKHYGWWTVIAIEAPRTIEFEDGFADQDFNPNPEMPTTKTIVTLDGPANGPTVMTIETRFPSLEAMEQMVEMGMEEGLTMAVGQIDGLLAAG
jgi:uncharacterized protein YndB with AHSA1/START domain